MNTRTDAQSSEQWLPVVGYEGYYEVSDLGNVRSVDRVVVSRTGIPRALKGKKLSLVEKSGDRGGMYWQVNLSRDAQAKGITVHQMVAAAFLGERPPGFDVCHANGNGQDNRAENLRYASRVENMQDAKNHGTLRFSGHVECSRGHRVSEENDYSTGVRKRNGWVTCKACHRARGYVQKHPELLDDLDAIADSYYEQIMKGAA